MSQKKIFTVYRPLRDKLELAVAIFNSNSNNKEFLLNHENPLVQFISKSAFNACFLLDSKSDKINEVVERHKQAIKDGIIKPAFTVESESIDGVFDVGCPLDENGEEMDWTTRECVAILDENLAISSVSVGDVIQANSGEVWVCCSFGWAKVA